MRIAISGASGTIGSGLTAALEVRGDVVVPLVRPGSDRAGIPWDPAAGDLVVADLEGFDAVINLSGRSIGERRWTSTEKQLVWHSRVQSTSLLAAALARLDRPPAVLVNASAVGYYGDGGDEILTESSPHGEGFLADLCVAWEEATTPASDAGITVARIRSGIVLSPEGGALGRLLAPFGPRWLSPYRWGLGGPVAGGRQWWSWISMSDEIAAIIHVVDNALGGPVNLVAPNPVTNRAFTRALGRVLRRPAVIPIPGFVLRLLLGSELAEALALTGQRVRPDALLESGFSFVDTAVEPALAAAIAD